MVSKFPIVFSCIFSLFATPTNAESSIVGWGQVNMQGTIISSACAITLDSREQTIDMDRYNSDSSNRGTHEHEKTFSIEFTNCGRDGWKNFLVTFDGDAKGDGFGIQGESSGIVLKIFDQFGNVVLPGKVLPLVDINSGNMNLNYSIKLLNNDETIKQAGYFSSVRFKLDYF